MSGNMTSSGVSHIIQNDKYPEWLRNHQVFKKLNKITKVFPGIGLPNTVETCNFSNIEISHYKVLSLPMAA